MRIPSLALLAALVALPLTAAACFRVFGGKRERVNLSVDPIEGRAIESVIVSCRECGYRHRFGTTGSLHVWALDDVPARIEVEYVEAGVSHQVVLAIGERGNPELKRTVSIAFPDSGDPVVDVSEQARGGRPVSVTDSGNPAYKRNVALNEAIERRDSVAVERLMAEAPLADRDVGHLMVAAANRGGPAVLAAVLAHAGQPSDKAVIGAITGATYRNDIESLRMLRRFWPADSTQLEQVLQSAAREAKLETIRWYVEEAGVPVNAPASQVGHTMLDFAVLVGRDEVAAYLRSKGGVAGVRRDPHD